MEYNSTCMYVLNYVLYWIINCYKWKYIYTNSVLPIFYDNFIIIALRFEIIRLTVQPTSFKGIPALMQINLMSDENDTVVFVSCVLSEIEIDQSIIATILLLQTNRKKEKRNRSNINFSSQNESLFTSHDISTFIYDLFIIYLLKWLWWLSTKWYINWKLHLYKAIGK